MLFSTLFVRHVNMDVEDLRTDIPAVDGTIYLNTGATSPSPRRVVKAMERTIEHHQYDAPGSDGMYPVAYEAFNEARDAVAHLINALPENVTLTQSTTDGLNVVAGGIDWDCSDTVVTTDLEHPSGILPWTRGGANIVRVESEQGRFNLDDWKDAVQDAQLVALSSISWNYGTKLPVQQIVELAHDAGALVAVDAAQSPGHVPVNVHDWDADFVAATGHKWLLGPWGAGFLYVHPNAESAIESHRQGSKSIDSFNYEAMTWEYKTGADRFHSATLSPSSYAGLEAAIEFQLAIGPENVLARIRELTQRLKEGLDDDRLLSPECFESGLVSFEADDPDALVTQLSDEDIEVRAIPYPDAVRVSIHAFNNEADIDTFLDAIK